VPGGPARRARLELCAALGLCAAVAGAALACLPAPAAHANPTPADLSQQLSTASQQLETVIEQYNAMQVRLSATQARRDAMAAQMAPVEQAIRGLEGQIGRYSAGLYERIGGGPVTALIAAGSPGNLLDELTMLDHLSGVTRRQVAELHAQQQRYAGQRRDLETVLALQAAQQADLAAKRTRIESQIAGLRQLRANLYGGRNPAAPHDRYVPPYRAGPAGLAIRYAYAQLGKPYRWGADGPESYDCSGLTMASWRAAGVLLPHSAALQWARVAHVSREQLQPGDLIFYYGNIHHVAIYIGDDKMIHSPTYGEDVTIAPVDNAPIFGYGRP
jgi:cell wall-associated NlpC family hydrolase